MSKKEVEIELVSRFYCPYCNTEHEEEFWAEQCRDNCYDGLEEAE